MFWPHARRGPGTRDKARPNAAAPWSPPPGADAAGSSGSYHAAPRPVRRRVTRVTHDTTF